MKAKERSKTKSRINEISQEETDLKALLLKYIYASYLARYIYTIVHTSIQSHLLFLLI
jgi:hypothetical protein